MTGSEAKLLDLMEGADKRYVIPVYQRKYNWKNENCRQLYRDLKKVVETNRESHFFGSIVSSVIGVGNKLEFHIIDGQQRLTTITLLLLAIRNLVKKGDLHPNAENLDDQVNQRYLISPWAAEDDKIKLRPVQGDREALARLFDADEENYDMTSNLTLNYNYFCEMLLKEEVMVDDLYTAIGKLEIISITLDPWDNAQLIFESLNSTGMALTEGDKIRNYILMGLSPLDQTKFYNSYWIKIEKCTADDVSGFVRDYLSIKQQSTPTISKVYQEFKTYAENSSMSAEEILIDLLQYSRFYEKLLTCKSGLGNRQLDDCLYRLKRLDIVVTRPFFMEVLRLCSDNKISVEDVLHVFLITENYLFRRNICEVPTNALNKIFLTLNKEVLRYDNTANDYVPKFIYALLSKKESGRFPDDREFTEDLATKQVYQMRGKYKAYLFERYENYGTVETKDVYTHLDNNDYTIEHIMPQQLTQTWMKSLGPDYEEIHATWLHRLANLTLTGYNPNLSNNTFIEKRDAEVGGYRDGGLRMNQKIAQKDSWGLPELEERNQDMINQAKKIWAYPQTNFVPVKKEFDSCTLDDEDVDLTGRDIVKFDYLNIEYPVSSWTSMFVEMVKILYQKDQSILTKLAYSNDGDTGLERYIGTSEDSMRDSGSSFKIDDHIYIQTHTSTASKISLLRRLFILYGENPIDLAFYLKDDNSGELSKTNRQELRKRYWTYALPIIQKQNEIRGSFSNVNPGTSNSIAGTFGIGGFCIVCAANYDSARVDFYMSKSDASKNKAAFDFLHKHKDEIETEIDVELTWERANDKKASWISYSLQNVSLTDEEDWPRMAKFHAEYSNKLCNAILPYLQKTDVKTSRLVDIEKVLRKWALSRNYVNVDINHSTRTHTRFTTQEMSEVLPDIKNAPSGWNTDNHYFYEIINTNGTNVFIQLVLNSKNASNELKGRLERINEFYPAKIKKTDWLWRTVYKTHKVEIGDDISEEDIFTGLDDCLKEIQNVEADIKDKLQLD